MKLLYTCATRIDTDVLYVPHTQYTELITDAVAVDDRTDFVKQLIIL